MGGFFRRLALGVRPHIGVKPARVQLPVSADTNKKNTRTDHAVHQQHVIFHMTLHVSGKTAVAMRQTMRIALVRNTAILRKMIVNQINNGVKQVRPKTPQPLQVRIKPVSARELKHATQPFPRPSWPQRHESTP